MTIPKEPSAGRVERARPVAIEVLSQCAMHFANPEIFRSALGGQSQEYVDQAIENAAKIIARSALIADEQALVDARIEGMQEAVNTVAGNVAASSELLSTENAVLFLSSLATSIKAIEVRIATLQSEQKERGDG